MSKQNEYLKQKIRAWLELMEKVTEEVECYLDDESWLGCCCKIWTAVRMF